MILYVETHWVLSCVLHQDLDAGRLFDPSPEPPRIYLPAFCIAEAIARFRTMERETNEFREQLNKRRRTAANMDLAQAKDLAAALDTAIQKQDQVVALLSLEFSAFMEGLFASNIGLIPESHAAIKRAGAYVDALDLSRGDAIVLATVVEHAAAQEAPRKAFLSGNTKDFGMATPAAAELGNAGIKSFSSVRNALGWIAAG